MENHLGTGWGVFYVEPTIVALCIEMYSKALASNLVLLGFLWVFEGGKWPEPF